jgi:hypothetical protein
MRSKSGLLPPKVTGLSIILSAVVIKTSLSDRDNFWALGPFHQILNTRFLHTLVIGMDPDRSKQKRVGTGQCQYLIGLFQGCADIERLFHASRLHPSEYRGRVLNKTRVIQMAVRINKCHGGALFISALKPLEYGFKK